MINKIILHPRMIFSCTDMFVYLNVHSTAPTIPPFNVTYSQWILGCDTKFL